MISCTDTYGKTIGYTYDEVGDLVKLTYPDNTYVSYEYDANHNLVKVTDWANRVTEYTYDKNNRVTGIVKPNGATVTTMYERNKVKKTVEKTASGTVISGFEYLYDNLSRIIEEKVLANSTKICYTYDELNRVTKRTIKDSSDVVLSEETFTYDLAGNLTDATGHCFAYGSNNKLVTFDGQGVSYDADGNMTFGNNTCCEYDSLNRLISAGTHDYTYNAENVRIRNKCDTHDTTYVYNTNCKLSQLLEKTTNGITTKYVYGLGLIGEEKQGCFKTYHFDSRGSTIALTDENGNITDTFAYDTYGKCISHTGDSFIIFGYNGRDGVVTDKNGLIYMRARYYSPDMKRFINADIVAGTITNATTLNRYAYANANPAMFTDPMGLSSCPLCGGAGCGFCDDIAAKSGSQAASNSSGVSRYKPNQNKKPSYSWDDDENGEVVSRDEYYGITDNTTNNSQPANKNRDYESETIEAKQEAIEESQCMQNIFSTAKTTVDLLSPMGEAYLKHLVSTASRPNNIGRGVYAKQQKLTLKAIEKTSLGLGIAYTVMFTGLNTYAGINENIANGESQKEITSDALIDIGGGAVSIGISVALYFGTPIALAKIGGLLGTTISPGVGTVAGVVIGLGVGLIYEHVADPILDYWF